MVPVAGSQPSRWTKDEGRDAMSQRQRKRLDQGPADPWAHSPTKTTLYSSAPDGTYPSMGARRYERFSKKEGGSWALHPPPSSVPPLGSYDPPSSFRFSLKLQSTTPLRSASPRAASPRSNAPFSSSPRSNAPLTKNLGLMATARAPAPTSIVPSQYYIQSRLDSTSSEPRKISARAKDPDWSPRRDTVASFMSVDKGSNIMHYVEPPYAPHVHLTLSRGAQSGMHTVSRRRAGRHIYVGPLLSRNGTPVLSHVPGRGVDG